MPVPSKAEKFKAEIIAFRNEGCSIREIGRRLDLDSATVTKWLKRWDDEGNVQEMRDPDPGVRPNKVKHVRRFVVTSALNNCPINENFLASIKTYCKVNNTQLIVIPVRYRNVSLYQKDYQVEWPEALNDYYITEDLELNSNLVILGSMRIQATAARPLQGTSGIAKGKSAIFGHPRLALHTVATPLMKLPLVYMTTGSISLPSYSETKQGKLGDFHHTMGAAIIETDGEYFWWRHIHANSQGGFCDLDKYYKNTGMYLADDAQAIVVGDIHVGFHSEAITDAIMDRLVKQIKPDNVVLHDVLDFFSASHHHQNNNVLNVLKEARGRNDVYAELESVAQFFQQYMHQGVNYYVVSSNHHDHLGKWLNCNSAQVDTKNLWLWHALNAAQLEAALDTAKTKPDQWHIASPFEMAMRQFMEDDHASQLHFPDDRQPLEFAGIDCGNHGHRGPNGVRGSARVFAGVQRKTFVGHTHQPAIVDGCFQVGMSCRQDLPYTSGYSSWLPTSGIIYADGTRTLIPIINGHYCMPEDAA